MSIFKFEQFIQDIDQHLESKPVQQLFEVAESLEREIDNFHQKIFQNANFNLQGAGYRKRIVDLVNSQLPRLSFYEIGGSVTLASGRLKEQSDHVSENIKSEIAEYIESTQNLVETLQTHRVAEEHDFKKLLDALRYFQAGRIKYRSLKVSLEATQQLLSLFPLPEAPLDSLKVSFGGPPLDLDQYAALMRFIHEVITLVTLNSSDPQETWVRPHSFHSGTANFSLIGTDGALDRVAEILEKIGAYIYRNHTLEGTFIRHTEMYKHLVELLQLNTILEESGHDMRAQNHEIKATLLKISRLIHSTVEHQETIEVNGRLTRLRDQYAGSLPPPQKQLPPPDNDVRLDFQA